METITTKFYIKYNSRFTERQWVPSSLLHFPLQTKTKSSCDTKWQDMHGCEIRKAERKNAKQKPKIHKTKYWRTLTGGSSCFSTLFIYLNKGFWITLLTDNGSSVVSIPLKLALVENISPRPSCKTYKDMLINYSFHLFGFTIFSKYIKWCWICRLQVIYLRRVGKLSQPWLFSFCINISVK